MSYQDYRMRLWLLKPVDGLSDDESPWEPWFDKAFGFVVRADSEESARKYANGVAGEENHECKGITPWLDNGYSTCQELTDEGKEGVILQDFHSA